MFHRRVNGRFALVLFVLLALLGPGAYALHSYQMSRHAGYLKSRGEAADADGESAQALNYLGRYLTLNPDDADARARHTTLLAKAATTFVQKEQALVAVERTIREGKATPEFRRKAADLALEVGQPATARVHLEALLTTSPNDAKVLEELARCEEYAGRTDQAERRYTDAIAADPKRVECYAHLARLLWGRGKAKEADDQIDKMVAVNPASDAAHRLRSSYLKQTNREVEAGKAIAEALKIAPNNADALLASADLALSRKEWDKARTEFAAGRKAHPKDVRFALGAAVVELRQGKPGEAAAALTDAEALAADKINDLWLVADLFVTANRPADAERLLGKLNKGRGVQSKNEYLQARVALAGGKWGEAADLFEKCRTGLAPVSDLALRTELYLAECYDRLGVPDKRLAAADRAFRLDKSNPATKMALADARIAVGEYDQAREAYTALANEYPDARFKALGLLIAQSQAKSGRAADYGPARKMLEETPAAWKESTEFALLAAQLLVAENKAADARKVLEAAQVKNPKEPRIWVALIAVTSRIDGARQTQLVLDKAAEALGDRVELRLARARAVLDVNGGASALKPFEEKLDKFTPADQTRLLTELARAYDAVAAPEEARRVLAEAARRAPADLGVQVTLLDHVADAGDPAAAAQIVDQVRKAEGEDGATWRYADAVRLLLTARKAPTPEAFKAAHTRLAEVKARRPGWYRVPLLGGMIAEAQGDRAAAAELYQQAVRNGARSPAVARKAAELLVSLRRYDEATQFLDGLKDMAAGTEMEKLSTLLALGRQDSADRVAGLAAGAVKKDSKNYKDQLWLGAVYAAAAKTAEKPADRDAKRKEAEDAYRAAVKLAPAAPEARMGLVLFLADADKKGEAKSEIEEAKKHVPAAQLTAVLAAGYEAIGEREEAGRQYAAMVAAQPNEPAVLRAKASFDLRGGDLAAAEKGLRAMIDRAGADALAAAWPRRALALALAAGGDYRRGTEALTLIDANLRLTPDSPEDRRAKAFILAGRPGGRQESIRTLEDSFAKLRPTPEEQFLLARLYEADGDWPKARDLFRSLITGRGSANPAFVGYFVRGLLTKGSGKYDPVEAARWMTRLEPPAGQPPSPLTVELKARLLVAQNKPGEAAAVINAFVARTTEGGSNPGALRAAGMLAAELGLTADADSLLQKYVAAARGKNPAAPLAVAEYLARRDRVGDALEACAQALAGGADPELVGRACVAVVRLGTVTPAVVSKAAAIIEKAAAAKPGSADLPVSRADLLDAQEQYDAAAAEYRAILGRNPMNVLAANNLAWLLAVRTPDASEALSLIDRAILTAGPVDNLLDTRGVVLLKAGRVDEAEKVLKSAIEQNPLAHVYHFHLAQVYEKAGRVADVRSAVRKAKELKLSEKELHALERADWRRLAAQVPEV